MLDKLVEKSIKISLFVQIVTTLISLDGLTMDLSKNDLILKDILKIETFVQVIEGAFYVWVMYALKDMNKMTPRRYIDWMITTPVMLLSTIIYFKYNEYKEKGISKPFTLEEFYDENNRHLINQWLMAQMGDIGPMLGQHHQFHHYNPGKSEFGENRYFKITKIFMVI